MFRWTYKLQKKIVEKKLCQTKVARLTKLPYPVVAMIVEGFLIPTEGIALLLVRAISVQWKEIFGDMKLKKRIINSVRPKREEQKVGQLQLAKMLGIPPIILSFIERGYVLPSEHMQTILAGALKVRPKHLFPKRPSL